MNDGWFEIFKVWLEENTDYRPRTIVKVLADLRTMIANEGVPPESKRSERMHDFRWVWDLWQEFREGSPGSRVPKLKFERPEIVVTKRRRKKEKPVYAAESIERGEWDKLGRVVTARATSDIDAAVISVLMHSGLRISDVLRASPRAIATAFKREDGIARVEVKGGKTVEIPVRGGAERAWAQLLEHTRVTKRDTFAACVAEGSHPEAGGAAYQRVRSTLFELGEAAGVSGRVHLHRLRRTVGVRLLEAGVPLEVVQKVFGHSSLRTTQGYTSESMARLAGEALRKINR